MSWVKVCCNVSFPYKSPGLGRYLSKDILLLATGILRESEEKILHFFCVGAIYNKLLPEFFLSILFLPMVVG